MISSLNQPSDWFETANIGQQPKRYKANIFYFKKSHYQYSLKVIKSSSPNMFGTA